MCEEKDNKTAVDILRKFCAEVDDVPIEQQSPCPEDIALWAVTYIRSSLTEIRRLEKENEKLQDENGSATKIAKKIVDMHEELLAASKALVDDIGSISDKKDNRNMEALLKSERVYARFKMAVKEFPVKPEEAGSPINVLIAVAGSVILLKEQAQGRELLNAINLMEIALGDCKK